jgi:hypothetical protein
MPNPPKTLLARRSLVLGDEETAAQATPPSSGRTPRLSAFSDGGDLLTPLPEGRFQRDGRRAVVDLKDRPRQLRVAIPLKYIPTWGQPNCPNFCAKSQAFDLLEKVQGSSAGFRGFSTDELNRILEHGTFIKPKVGDKVLVAGEPSSFFVLVLSGAVEVVNAIESTGGSKILIQKGELLGDLALLLASFLSPLAFSQRFPIAIAESPHHECWSASHTLTDIPNVTQ